MTRRHPFALTLPVLLGLAALVPPGAALAAEPADDARALVDSVAARYLRLPGYRFEGVVQARASGASLPEAQELAIPFRYAAVRPSKLLNEALNPYMPTRLVADGESLRISAPALKQYSVQKAPAFSPGVQPDLASRSLEPVLTLAFGLGAGLTRARSLGPDTVHTAAGPVPCRRVELTYVADTLQRQSRALPRIVWLDEARGLVLRDSTTTEMTHPQFGYVRQVQDARYVVAEAGGPVPDSLFRFTPPRDSKRVRRIGQGVNDPDDAGKPASDFSLALLDGKGRKVSLSAHKGKVVVLDFWATWCGPCRRWMPIVAKLERETAGRNVKFFAVNVREPVPAVRAYVREQKVEVPVLLDTDGKVGTAYGARSIPLTVVVGRDGKIVRSLLGLHPEEDLRDALREAGVEGL